MVIISLLRHPTTTSCIMALATITCEDWTSIACKLWQLFNRHIWIQSLVWPFREGISSVVLKTKTCVYGHWITPSTTSSPLFTHLTTISPRSKVILTNIQATTIIHYFIHQIEQAKSRWVLSSRKKYNLSVWCLTRNPWTLSVLYR